MLEDDTIPMSNPKAQIDNKNSTYIENQKVWNDCLRIIQDRVNKQSFKTWFEPIILVSINDGRITMKVPSQFFSEWLEEHYYSLLNEVFAQVFGHEMTIEYIIASDDRDLPTNDFEDDIAPSELSRVAGSFPKQNISTLESSIKESPDLIIKKPINPSLNPRYTFENYIKGESNQFARAAALAVANNPGGTSFNPLVIYGGVGLGKTHLVHAIGNHLLKSGKTHRILYVSSEKFTIDFVESIQKDRVAEFTNYYRNVDLLIVDDIQFFASKEKTQDMFFHTFNALYHLGKQIVLSSDKPPKDLKGVNERLVSRFQWGLTADIQPPDLETRIAILRKKISDSRIDLSHDIVEFIASNVTTNIRELESCLIGLLARASLENREVDLDLAKSVVKSIVGEVRSLITIEEIQRVVAEHVGIPEDLLRAKTRKQEVVNARQISMYLAKELTNSSLKTIGLHFGGRDHSTVIHAYQCVEDGMKTDPKQKALIQQLRSKIEHNIL